MTRSISFLPKVAQRMLHQVLKNGGRGAARSRFSAMTSTNLREVGLPLQRGLMLCNSYSAATPISVYLQRGERSTVPRRGKAQRLLLLPSGNEAVIHSIAWLIATVGCKCNSWMVRISCTVRSGPYCIRGQSQR